jgi:endonuclease/exonuclease/phosphatase family metal-dependent hydrolase
MIANKRVSGVRDPHPTVASTQRRTLPPVGVVVLSTFLLATCSVHRAPADLPGHPTCLGTDVTAGLAPDGVEWVLREEPDERSALDAWCWAVGPAVWADFVPADSRPDLDSIAVVAWNAEVGHGRLTELIADLRSGALTGAPVRDFVLLLQEVHRAGEGVPNRVPQWAAVPRRVGDPGMAGRIDIVEVARRERLSLLYAPSMRNGHANENGLAEDRGNAILSTLPLRSPEILELPYERQRRVAVLASIDALDDAGEPWTLRFASVHLDNRARFGRIYRSFGMARHNQARTLAEHVSDLDAIVVGGDLNTWMPGGDAAAVDALRAGLPFPADPPREGTAELRWLFPNLQLDHLLFRVPEGWDAGYRVAGDTYGSDHYPLIGWIRGR